MTTVWLLIFLAGHSYGTVSGIGSQSECERVYAELKATNWVASGMTSNDHRCVSYDGAVRR
jgi:hypothetical protein